MFSSVSMSTPNTSAYSTLKPATPPPAAPAPSVFSAETAGSVACSSSSFSVMA